VSTKVEIGNLALYHIRNNVTINSFTEESNEAVIINNVYEHCKKIVLESKSWGFCSTVKELTRLSEGQETVFPYLYAYAVPSNCIRINDIINYTSYINYTDRVKVIPYEKRVNSDASATIILTNEKAPILRYNINITNSELFSQIFSECLSWYIGFQIAPALTNDENLRQLCFQGYQSSLQAATVFDNNEDNYVNLNTCNYEASR